MRSLSGIKKQVAELIHLFGGDRRILAATVDQRNGAVRSLLFSRPGSHAVPPGMMEEDLPPDCPRHHYDPAAECATLYRSTYDGRAHVQRILGVDEDVLLGRTPANV